LKNNILLITENYRLAQKIRSKIILLRNTDNFNILESENTFSEIKEKEPSIILYHLTKYNEEDFLVFIQKIKQSQDFKTCPVILLYDQINEDILCSAFELGIADFVSTKATETELTVRTIWAIKKLEKEIELQKNSRILSELKIIDNKNFVFTENYAATIIKNIVANNEGSFVLISPDINVRNKISAEFFINFIKNNLRNLDILGFYDENKIYLWLEKTTCQNALNIVKKIQKKCAADFSFSASCIETLNLDYETLNNLAVKALSKALLKGNSVTIAKKEKEKEKKDYTNEEKLENFLLPLFYQYQKIKEEKLFETKIKQKLEKNNCFFKLENEYGQSSFIVKIKNKNCFIIELLHNIINMELKAEVVSIQNNNLYKEEIEKLLIKFIDDFQRFTNC